MKSPTAINIATPIVLLTAAFALTNDAGAPASLTILGGDGQDATVGTAFAASLRANRCS